MSKILNSTIGIAGCGTMGLPMLEVLLKNNINAFGYDIISKESFSSLENNFISSKKDFFQKVDVIFSVVRDINQTKELCEGKNGLFQLNSPKTLIISSTLSPFACSNNVSIYSILTPSAQTVSVSTNAAAFNAPATFSESKNCFRLE